MIYLIGERLHSKRVGPCCISAVGSESFHVEHSHYITVDVPLTCLSLACLLFIIKIDDMGKPGDYIWAAIF
ncbi:MAG: hypothetical protein IPJ33_04235 [Gammaproteobacteria bacterium]|nr:hypothetical protein [Gammaproteobacteria bacterium]